MCATSAESLVSAARSYLAAVDAVAAVGGGVSEPGDARDRTRRVLLEHLAGFGAPAHPPCFRRIFVPVELG